MTPLEKRKIAREQSKQFNKNSLVKTSNNFIEGFIKKNRAEVIKILFYLARTNKELKRNEDNTTFKIDIGHMVEYCQIDTRTLFRNLKRLQETSITILDNEEEFISLSLLPKIHRHYNDNSLDISIPNLIREQIIDVKNKYTSINIDKLMKLKNKHSLKLLPLLEKLDGYSADIPKRAHFDLEDLNDFFGVNYQSCFDLERKILIPVKEELDAECNISFVYNTKQDLQGKGRPKSIGFIIDLINNKIRQPSFSFN